MSTADEASAAIAAMSGAMLDVHPLKVNEAQERPGGVPGGIRTLVSDVKSRGPGPLDDGDGFG